MIAQTFSTVLPSEIALMAALSGSGSRAVEYFAESGKILGCEGYVVDMTQQRALEDAVAEKPSGWLSLGRWHPAWPMKLGLR